MVNREDILQNFFNQYCEVFNNAIKTETPDIEQTAGLFATSFVSANPAGVSCGNNDESFREAMKTGYAFYKTIGIISMEIVSNNFTMLDDYHTMARIRWSSKFTKKNGSTGSIEFENIYFIQSKNDEHKVFAYITGDEQAALKENGLI